MFSLYFLALGMVSGISQMIFLREVLVSFRGNELFLNYFLILWLVFVGLGSWLGNKLKFFKFFYLITTLFALLSFLALRFLPLALNFTTEIPSLSSFLIFLPLIVLAISLFWGIGFSSGSQYFSNNLNGSIVSLVNRAYLLETFGFFSASLTFNFWLIKVSGLKLIFLILIIWLAIGWLDFIFKKQLAFALLNLMTIFLFGYFFIKADFYELKTANWRFPQEKILLSSNSFWGNIVVTEKEKQNNFYGNGSLALLPQDFQISEEIVHLPLLFTPLETKSLTGLIIGDALSGSLKEALKYPNLEISYLPLDPEFLPNVYNFLTQEQKGELNNQRVKIINKNSLSYLTSKYDFILLNLSPATTYQANRFWTKEFFQLVKTSLSPKGIFSLNLPYYPENLNNPNLNRFLTSIFNPFQQIFPNHLLIPGQKLILLGFKSNNREIAPKARETRFLSPRQIDYLLKNERQTQILKELPKTTASSNTNLSPLGVIYYLISQTEISQPKISWLLNKVLEYRWLIFALLIIFSLFLLFPPKNSGFSQNKIRLIALFASGLSLIFEIFLIFVWQITIGYIYKEISLIIGLIMLGIFLANLYLYLKTPFDRAKSLKIFLLSLLALAFGLLVFLLTLNSFQVWVIKIIIASLALISGYLAGGIYPLVNSLYLGKSQIPHEETGKIYGLELLGGGILLIIFSLFILPFLGLLSFILFLIYWIFLIYFISLRKLGQ